MRIPIALQPNIRLRDCEPDIIFGVIFQRAAEFALLGSGSSTQINEICELYVEI